MSIQRRKVGRTERQEGSDKELFPKLLMETVDEEDDEQQPKD